MRKIVLFISFLILSLAGLTSSGTTQPAPAVNSHPTQEVSVTNAMQDGSHLAFKRQDRNSSFASLYCDWVESEDDIDAIAKKIGLAYSFTGACHHSATFNLSNAEQSTSLLLDPAAGIANRYILLRTFRI